MEVTSWTTRARWVADYSADSVEWCPVEPYHHILACGTYQLDKTEPKTESGDQPDKTTQKTKQKRLGRIYLFTVDDTAKMTLLHTVDCSGILDQKWCYHTINGKPVLAVVTSCGKLVLYQLIEKEENNFSLEFCMDYSLGENVLGLSLDWSTNKTESEHRIVVSDSSGAVTVLRLEGEALVKIGEWKSHGFEAWIAAFNYWNQDVFYSGGDDCVFKSYDVRVPEVATVTNRSHEAGVTSIRSHVDVQYQLLTGSYDENIRLWDTRSLKRCISEMNVNGGVWRMKWHPHKTNVILAACMYGGFRLLKLEGELRVVEEYMEHESIAYGADWQFIERPLVATCSFYDCKLHVSEVVV